MHQRRRVTALRVALIGASLVYMSPAYAHGIAGARVFPVTLTTDDPSVADEASLPTFVYQPNGPTSEYAYGFEWDKRITENLGVAISDSYRMVRQPAELGGNLHGWDNPVATLKYRFLVDDAHELMASVGLQKEFGGVGATNHGLAEATGWTQPTLYVGKGMGDLPPSLGLLRPFAITGEFGYQWADVPSQIAADGTRIHNPDFVNLGFSVQYSLEYLHAQVKDYGLPEFANHLIPIVEFSYSTPAGTSNPGTTTTGTIAPGLLYVGSSYQLGVEALIPATHASGSYTGVIAQFHMFLDDLLPTTLGKPLFSGI
jgi:hypothetical protein